MPHHSSFTKFHCSTIPVEEEEVDIDALMAAAPFLGGAGMNFHKVWTTIIFLFWLNRLLHSEIQGTSQEQMSLNRQWMMNLTNFSRMNTEMRISGISAR